MDGDENNHPEVVAQTKEDKHHMFSLIFRY